MRNRLFPFTAFPFLAIVLSGCGGSSQQGSVGPPGAGRNPLATPGRADIIGGDGSPATADSVPVSVKITATVGDIPFNEVIGYDVYRTPTAKISDATLVGSQEGNGQLLIYDNSLPVGTRTDYKVIINYNSGNAADGTPILKAKNLQSTNFVTQIEPTENADVTPVGAGVVTVSVPATLGADDYVLYVSTDSTFNTKQRFTPTSKGTYSTTADAPRHGTTVTFGAINVAQAFPSATTLYLRVGARDSRNGTANSNPYVFTDSQQFTTP